MTQPVQGRSAFSLRRGVEMFEREQQQFLATFRENPDMAQDCWGLSLLHALKSEDITDVSEKLGFEAKQAVDYYNRGVVAATRENYPKAIDHFRRAAELDSTLLQAIYNLAVCYERMKQIPPAISTWQTYLDSLKDQGAKDEAKVVRDRIAELKASQKS